MQFSRFKVYETLGISEKHIGDGVIFSDGRGVVSWAEGGMTLYETEEEMFNDCSSTGKSVRHMNDIPEAPRDALDFFVYKAIQRVGARVHNVQDFVEALWSMGVKMSLDRQAMSQYMNTRRTAMSMTNNMYNPVSGSIHPEIMAQIADDEERRVRQAQAMPSVIMGVDLSNTGDQTAFVQEQLKKYVSGPAIERKINPDGSVTAIYPDGRTVTKNHDGTWTQGTVATAAQEQILGRIVEDIAPSLSMSVADVWKHVKDIISGG